MTRRYSSRFERDWTFYVTNIGRLTFCGERVDEPPHDENGIDAKAYFHRLDSRGARAVANVGCKEPKVLRDVLFFKKALNFQIKQWAEGFDDFMEDVEFYLTTFVCPPEWVGVAILCQAEKVRGNRA